MKHSKDFPFDKARRITPAEVKAHLKAIEAKTGKKRSLRGRPPKSTSEKYQAVAIRLHPKVIKWAKSEAKKQGIGYQTILNRALLKFAA